MTRHWLFIFVLLFTAIRCAEKEDMGMPQPLLLFDVPPGFPDIVHADGNEYTEARWKLGKKLFYDPILSKDRTVSCASCHDPKIAFSDQKPFSEGVGGAIGTRNSPTLANVAYHPYFTREGGVPTLEMQVLVPIQEHNEFNNNIVLIADTLSQIEEYIQLASEAYDQAPNPYVITRALALFERSLISGQSRYDIEVNYGIDDILSESEERGMQLFMSERTNCSSCHSGFNFTNYTFENNGLYEEYPDIGRARFTQKSEDIALFKIPTLRNIALTPPYMHDGSLATLEDVIDHYNMGGKEHPNKSLLIKPLALTEEEKTDLIAFLHALTDENFVNNQLFQK